MVGSSFDCQSTGAMVGSSFDCQSTGSDAGSVGSFSFSSTVQNEAEPHRPPLPPEAAASKSLDSAEKLYVAVDKEFKQSKKNIIWALKNTPKSKKIVIVHVHVPAQMIPMMGAMFPADQMKPQEAQAFRVMEKAKMNKAINDYVERCSGIKELPPEKLVIEADDVGNGLLLLIRQHKITHLVMGAASDKNYSKKMKEPRSKKALTVQKEADPACKVWFVCKGNLICTREAGSSASTTIQTPKMGSPIAKHERTSTKPSSQMLGQLLNYIPGHNKEAKMQQPVPPSPDPGEWSKIAALPQESFHEFSSSQGSRDGIIIDLWDNMSRSSYGSGRSLISDNVLSTTNSIRAENEVGTSVLPLLESDENHRYMEEAGLDDELYKDLRHAMTEAKNLTREAFEESLRRQRAERDFYEASQKVREAEDLYTSEIKQRKEIEERLLKEQRELEVLRKQRNEMFQEIHKANEQRASLEQQLTESKRIANDFEKRLSEAHYLLISLESEHVELRSQRDEALKEVEQIRQKLEEIATSNQAPEIFSEFSYSELQQATNHFDASQKIGEGGYGTVFKGIIREKTVAIKMLNSQGLQGQKEFHKEVNVLSQLRHPNLVSLIGSCPESWALVYEFLPNGSLEDRLTCKDNTPPLPWQARIRIAAEICSALNFLHSNKQLSVVHGDLKPANILLDANFISKLGDFGICRLIQSTNSTSTLYRCTHAMGTFVYMDPEFLASGDLTPRSDVYSFGIIVLRLLTGRAAFGINRLVQDAIDRGCLKEVLDSAAGVWPYTETEKLACLALRCCEITRRTRPDSAEVWRILESLSKAVSLASLPIMTSGTASDDNHPGSIPFPYRSGSESSSSGLPPLPFRRT